MKFIFRTIFSYIVLYLIFAISIILSGCAGLGMSFEESRTIAITKAPYQIILSGDIQSIDRETIKDILLMLQSEDFKMYNFDDDIKIKVLSNHNDLETINVTGYTQEKQDVENNESY